MTKQTKVYRLRGMASARLMTRWCNTDVELNFRNGMGANGHESATLITSELFVQDAIEHDSRFESLIRLENVYDNESRAKNEYQQTGSPNVDAQSAQRRAAEEAERALADAEAQKKQVIREKRAKAKKQAESAPTTGSPSSVTFADKNEALHFFLEKGEEVTEDTLPRLLAKYNAVISE